MFNDSEVLSDQDELRKILRSKITSEEFCYEDEDFKDVLHNSYNWINGHQEQFSCITSGYFCTRGEIVQKTFIKINGEVFDTYNSRVILGRGGFGTVFIAKNIKTSNYYPIKYAEGQSTFREYEYYCQSGLAHGWAQSSIVHPNIDANLRSHHGYVQASYMVMPYLGKTLKDYMKRKKYSIENGNLTAECYSIAIEAAISLSRLHIVNKLAHLDIKPGNMFYRPKRPLGEKITFGDFGGSEPVNKRVFGDRGTIPYYFCDNRYANIKRHASERDIRMLQRTLTGVSSENVSRTDPYQRALGLISKKTLTKYDLEDLLFFDPNTFAIDISPPSALIIAAKLIAHRFDICAHTKQAILERESLAARIVCNYIIEKQFTDVENCERIREWAINPDLFIENAYLTLFKLDLLDKAVFAIENQEFMAIVDSTSYSRDFKKAVALLFKQHMFMPDKVSKVESLDLSILKMLVQAGEMQKWDIFKRILTEDLNPKDYGEIQKNHLAIKYEPQDHYIDEDVMPVKTDPNFLLWLWLSKVFEDIYKYEKRRFSPEEKEFHWWCIKRRTIICPDFSEALDWLRTLDSNYSVLFARALINQTTKINIARVLLSLKDRFNLSQLEHIIRYEKEFNDYFVRKSIDPSEHPTLNWHNIVLFSEVVEFSTDCERIEIVGYLLSNSEIPDFISNYPRNFLCDLFNNRNSIENFTECMLEKKYVDACHLVYKKVTYITFYHAVKLLAADLKRGVYNSIDSINSLELSQTSGSFIIDFIRKLRRRYLLAEQYPDLIEEYDKHQNLQILVNSLICLNIKPTDKDIHNKLKANIKNVLELYKLLDKISIAVDLGDLHNSIASSVSSYVNFYNFELIDTHMLFANLNSLVGNFLLSNEVTSALRAYDREKSQANNNFALAIFGLHAFNKDTMTASAARINQILSKIMQSIGKLQEQEVASSRSSRIHPVMGA